MCSHYTSPTHLCPGIEGEPQRLAKLVPIYRPILAIFQISALADKFSVWPMRSRWDFYFDGADNSSHSPFCSPSSLTVLSIQI